MSEINELRCGILLGSVALASSFIVPPMAAIAAEPAGKSLRVSAEASPSRRG